MRKLVSSGWKSRFFRALHFERQCQEIRGEKEKDNKRAYNKSRKAKKRAGFNWRDNETHNEEKPTCVLYLTASRI